MYKMKGQRGGKGELNGGSDVQNSGILNFIDAIKIQPQTVRQ